MFWAGMGVGEWGGRRGVWGWRGEGRGMGGVVAVFTSNRKIKSAVTGQAPVTLEWNNTPGIKQNKTKLERGTHVNINAEASRGEWSVMKGGMYSICAWS